MSYHLVIEGINGARHVRSGELPRRGEWLKVCLGRECWWLPVLEVAHLLSRATQPGADEDGADAAHERAEALLVSSLAMGVRANEGSADDTYQFVLPPPRWPLGGCTEGLGNWKDVLDGE